MLVWLGLALALNGGRGAAQVPIEVPPAEDCRVPPRPIEDIARLGAAATTTATSGTPIVEPATVLGMASPAASAGFPRVADTATTEAINAVIREFMACINAGAPQRTFALLSDENVRGALFPFGPAELTNEDIAAITAVNPLRNKELEGLRGIGEVILVDDTTAHVDVVADKVRALRAEPNHEPRLFILIKEGDCWLIDIF